MKFIKKNLLLLTLVFLGSHCIYAQSFYDVTKYGAKKDSSAKATLAIKKAIDAASKAGGGTIYFTPAFYGNVLRFICIE